MFAQWNTNPSINTPVTIAAKGQQNTHSISDTKNGAIVAWDDNRDNTTNSSDIYAQRLKSNGFTKWTSAGVAICTHTATQKNSSIVSGGIDGSAIITWEDDRAGVGNFDIYAQKIDSSGNVLWSPNGVVICNKATTQRDAKIVSDNAGGAIIVWEDSTNFYFDVYAQRINANGLVQWTANGVAICTAQNTQNNPKIDTDGLGGAIITWQDKRNNTDYDVYAQRINSSGAIQWAANGVVICNSTNVQNNPRIEPDGANGALIAWADKRNGNDYDVYLQRINSSGVIQWSSNGTLICNATGNQSAIDLKSLSNNGAMITWKDERAGKFQIYAQWINLNGTVQFASNGLLLSNAIKSINPNAINDGTNGSIIVWQDSTTLGWDIKTQRIDMNGSLLWATGGITVSNASDDQINPSQVSNGNGGAVFIWEDRRNAANYDIYAHRLYSNGNAMVGIQENNNNNLFSQCFPNPINNESTIELKNNMTNQDWDIVIYNALGKIIKNVSVKANEKLKINIEEFPKGIYFYNISLSDKSYFTSSRFITVN